VYWQGSLSAGLLYPSSVQRTAQKSTDPSGEQIIITSSASALEHGIFSCECCILSTSLSPSRSAPAVGSEAGVLIRPGRCSLCGLVCLADKNGTGSGAMLSYSLRKDGWVFLESSGGIGIVGTRIFWLSHGEVAVNLNAATGRVRCRATDQHNKPLDGYDWDDSVPCEGCNTLAWIPQWQNQHNLSSLAGQGSHSVIRLEFEMVNARLVSAAATSITNPISGLPSVELM
jgi:hypothetical protein